jgi:putative selenium metabolism protein SsnA
VSTTVLAGGTVVTSLSPPEVVEADVTMANGRIVDVGTGEPPSGASVLDCSGCLVMPGLVCAHHHLYSSLARGMPLTLAPPRSFVEILRRVWWRLDRALTPGDVWMSAWAGGADAVLAGTTTIVDHHASPHAIEGSLDQVGSALARLGVRGVLCYEVSDRDGPERAEAGIKENRRFLEQREGLEETRSSLLRGMVGAHASFTLSQDTLTACADAARELGSGIHVHVAEDGADQRDAMARFGRRVVTRLAEAGALDERTLLAHCVHLDDDELEMLRAAGATAVHNPRSNMNNAVGHAPVERFDRLALGTDGVSGDMFEEAQAAYWRAREASLEVTPQWALDRLAESARFVAAAFDQPLLGRIETGAPADVLVLEYAPPTPFTAKNLAGHLVFGLSARMVRDVLVAGEEVVRDRTLVRVDERELRARCREAAKALWRRVEQIPEHPFVPAGGG